jgi:hypothetical protein
LEIPCKRNRCKRFPRRKARRADIFNIGGNHNWFRWKTAKCMVGDWFDCEPKPYETTREEGKTTKERKTIRPRPHKFPPIEIGHQSQRRYLLSAKQNQNENSKSLNKIR